MKGLSITGFCLSLTALIFGIFPLAFAGWASVIALPIAIVALCLSSAGAKKYKDAGANAALATAGMIIAIAATVYTSITFASCGLCTILSTIVK